MENETITRVFRNRSWTATVTMFPYGHLWRVKYEKVSNSHKDSVLLASHDEEHDTRAQAEIAYKAMVGVLEANGKVWEGEGSKRMEAARQQQMLRDAGKMIG